MNDTAPRAESRITAADLAKIIGIDADETLKIAIIESVLNIEWWRGYSAGVVAVDKKWTESIDRLKGRPAA